MEIKPQDIKVDVVTTTGNWGMRSMTKVTVTHVPTGLEASCSGNTSQHRARAIAFESLLKRLEQNTDYYKQMELFNE